MNISGFIINRNLKDEISTVAENLNLKLEFHSEINFEESTRSKYKSTAVFADFFFTEKGTLLFCDDQFFNQNGFSKLIRENYEGFAFRFSETAMVFNFEHYRDRGYHDNLWITYDDGFKVNMREDVGYLNMENKRIEITENTDIVFNIFSQVMEELIGENFDKVDFGATAYRYQISR